MKRKVLFPLILILMLVGLAEIVSYAAIRILQSKGMTYLPPAADGSNPREFEEYLAKRDDELGWPDPKMFGGEKYDEEGGRRNPDYGDVSGVPPCVSTFGDSFMAGQKVADEHVWSVQLGRSLGCRVANFGVGGYGSDQAYLRYQRMSKNAANIVVLGHFSENVLRNSMRLRDLYSGVREHGLKPRFVWSEDGTLELVPLPNVNAEEFERVVGLASPPLVLEHEYFYPGGLANPVLVTPPFTWSLLKSLSHFRLKARLQGVPAYHAFYHPDHPADALRVTAGIFRNFVRDVHQAGGQPFILIFAVPDDVEFLQENNESVYQPLLDIMDREGIPYIDMAAILLEYLGDRDAEELIVQGHYDEEGNKLVATAVEAFMLQNGLIDSLDSGPR
jgi:hypothetical protein